MQGFTKLPLSPEQCRAARALIGWSQDQLSQASKVAKATIANFEAGKRAPYDRTLADIVAALEDAGVVLIPENGEGRGVRLRKDRPDSASFRSFIMRSAITNDPEGDFIRDARADRQMPDAKEWSDILGYLESIHAKPAAIAAAETVWTRYLAEKARQG